MTLLPTNQKHNVYLSWSLYFLIIGIIVICLAVLSVNFEFKSFLDVIRLDKFEIHRSAWRYFFATAGVILSGWFVYNFGIGRRIILLPTAVFFTFLVIQVFPGVIITASADQVGNIAVYGYTLSLICFSVGVMATSTLLDYQPTKEVNYYYNRFSSLPYIDDIARKWVFTIAITGVVLLFFGVGIKQSGALSGIISFLSTGFVSDIAKDVQAARMAKYHSNLSSAAVVLGYLNRLVMPIVASSLILYGSTMRNRILQWTGFLLVVFLILMLIGSGSRLSVGQIIIYLLVVYTLTKPLDIKKIIWIALASTVILTLMTIALGRFSGGEGFIVNSIMAVNRVAERVFLSKGNATLIVFEYFPSVDDYQMGKTIISQFAGRASETPTLAQKMMEYKFGKLGTAGPQAFGEAYANFGIIGMVLYSFSIGMVLQLISIYIVRRIKIEPHTISITGYFIFLCAYSGYSGIVSFKTNGLHILLIYALFSKLVIYLLRGVVVKKGISGIRECPMNAKKCGY